MGSREPINLVDFGPSVHGPGPRGPSVRGSAARFRAVLATAVTALGAALLPPATAVAAEPPCAVWVVRNALVTAGAWAEAIDAVERVGCDRIYLQVSGRWDAYFPSEVFTPPAAPPRGEGWADDPFGHAVEEAHARGIEVHAWVNALIAWSAEEPPPDPRHPFRAHPDWFVTDARGRSMREMGRADLDRAGLVGEGWFLDPAREAVRSQLRRFVLEVALRYPVDGVHLDYIRYPAGWAPPGGAGNVTRLVALVRSDLRTVRPGVQLSAAVMPRPEVARESFGQDWGAWLREGLVDEVAPMVYRDSPEAVLRTVEAWPADLPRDRVRVGIRIDRLTPEETRETARRVARAGAAGVALFSHVLLLEEPSWRRAGTLGLAPAVGGNEKGAAAGGPSSFAPGSGSGQLLDLAGADAGGAHADPAPGAVHHRADGLQVRQEASPLPVVRVAHRVPGLRRLAADVTLLGHGDSRTFRMVRRQILEISRIPARGQPAPGGSSGVVLALEPDAGAAGGTVADGDAPRPATDRTILGVDLLGSAAGVEAERHRGAAPRAAAPGLGVDDAVGGRRDRLVPEGGGPRLAEGDRGFVGPIHPASIVSEPPRFVKRGRPRAPKAPAGVVVGTFAGRRPILTVR